MKLQKFNTIVSLLCLLSAPNIVTAEPDPNEDTTTKTNLLEMFRDNKDNIPLDTRDGSADVTSLYRTDCDRPAQKPINIQRATLGMAYQGIPTFFKSPVALCPQDLRFKVKGQIVDIAIMGASLDMGVGQRGTAFAPQAIRTAERINPWGTKIAHPTVGYVDPLTDLRVVDFGDAPIDILSVERSINSVYNMVTSIIKGSLSKDAKLPPNAKKTIPIIVGGDHSLMYPDVRAVVDAYPNKTIGVIHFDAHFDGIARMFGHYLSHGAPVRRLIDEGHIKGRHFVQIGLNSGKPGGSDIKWMRDNEIQYFFMNEIDRFGWKKVFNEALEAVKDVDYIFMSIDTDVLDPAWAPGMGTPEPGGMSIRELFPMIRGFAIAKEVVGVDLVEVNPIVDQTYRSRFVALRMLREVMTGIALRRTTGITDPFHVDPKWGKGYKSPTAAKDGK